MQNKIVMVGFGNLGQALLPLLEDQFAQYAVVAIDQCVDDARLALAQRHGIRLLEQRLSASNFAAVLTPWLAPGDFLLNLAPAVSTCALIGVAHACGALYLDTGIEPWDYAQDRAAGPAPYTSNYDLREQLLAYRRASAQRGTAVVAHGANPGFVSVLLKQALLEMAASARPPGWAGIVPTDRQGWARLAAALDIRVIQIAEHDSQREAQARGAGEFVNTWSVPGFIAECLQHAEIGFGTHEPVLPALARRHRYGCRAAIQLGQPGHATRVKSWSPLRGPFDAYVITHNEAISIADYLSLGTPERPVYRPTVYFAYRPSAAAIESLALLHTGEGGGGFAQRVLKAELTHGEDELGVLVMSGTYASLWLGSALSIERARALAPYNNATSLQVVSSLAGAMHWACRNPWAGIVESEQLDHGELYAYTSPYWEPIQRQYTQWRPQPGAQQLAFAEFQHDAASESQRLLPSNV
jgi:homospermidine synthase